MYGCCCRGPVPLMVACWLLVVLRTQTWMRMRNGRAIMTAYALLAPSLSVMLTTSVCALHSIAQSIVHAVAQSRAKLQGELTQKTIAHQHLASRCAKLRCEARRQELILQEAKEKARSATTVWHTKQKSKEMEEKGNHTAAV